MKKTFLIINFLFFVIHSYGQYEAAHWFFGTHAGLDFTSGAPVPEPGSQIDTEEGCSSISNACGDLLLYTDGKTIWNANHQVMLNGTGLKGDDSSTQSGIVVPNPDDENIYYVFTVDDAYGSPSVDGMRYSVVDMTLDGGLGGVVTTQKNIPLVTSASEKVTAVISSDGSSVWVITLAPRTNSSSAPYTTIGSNFNTFYAFRITGTGVQTTATVSTLSLNISHGIGYMKASPDGNKLAIANTQDDSAYLFDFDNTTGTISNPVSLSLNFNNNHPYGLEFSPDSSKLYLGDKFSRVTQFDLANNNQPTLLSSRNNYRSALQLGLDGKIYQTATVDYGVGTHFLSVIEDPNVAGTACHYRYRYVNLPTSMTVHQGLPPFIQSYFVQIAAPDVTADFTNVLEVESNEEIASVDWDFGDSSTTTTFPDNPPDNTHSQANHSYATPGTYTITAILHLVLGCDVTVTKTVVIPPVIDPGLTSFCSNNTSGIEAIDLHQFDQLIIDRQSNNTASYIIRYYLNEQDALTAQNEITGLYTNTTNHDTLYYSVTNTSANTTSYGTFYLTINPKPEILPVSIYEICDTDSDEIAEIDLTAKITEILGTRSTPPYEVKFYPTQNDAETDTNMIANPETYTNVTPAHETIWYSITDTVSGCQNEGSFELIIHALPEINMDDTYMLCIGQSIQIDAPAGFAAYNWSTGDTTQDIMVNTAGDYTLTVTDNNGCSNSKTINVTASDVAVIDRVDVNDFNINDNNSITVNASGIGDYEYSIDGMNYQDSNIFTDLYPGTYTVYVSDKNGCGLTTQEVDLLGSPQYFTPNGDGFNDVWQIINITKKQEAVIQIFNRYGKLIKVLGVSDTGWDGTFNGNPMPADDYWFTVVIKENNGKSRQVKGHFALKR